MGQKRQTCLKLGVRSKPQKKKVIEVCIKKIGWVKASRFDLVCKKIGGRGLFIGWEVKGEIEPALRKGIEKSTMTWKKEGKHNNNCSGAGKLDRGGGASPSGTRGPKESRKRERYAYPHVTRKKKTLQMTDPLEEKERRGNLGIGSGEQRGWGKQQGARD